MEVARSNRVLAIMKQYEIKEIQDEIIDDVINQLDDAVTKHLKQYASPHEAYAIIQEELDEFWDEVKTQKPSKRRMRAELIHVAVTAVRAIRDLNLTLEHMLPKDDDDE